MQWHQNKISLKQKLYPKGRKIIPRFGWLHLGVKWHQDKQNPTKTKMSSKTEKKNHTKIHVTTIKYWTFFITLSCIIRTCGHVMDDVITLWWSCESWCDFLRLGRNFCLGGILFVMVWFHTLVQSTESFSEIYFFWCRCISWCDQLHLGMIFLHFARFFRLSVILFDLV